MKVELYSYRFAKEILQHPAHGDAWREIEAAVAEAPLFVWPGKSEKNSRLDVVQQLLNTWFDRRFSIDLNWEHHPIATKIVGSNLRADFRKTFGTTSVQTEVQFGNMARWYSDIFKFQAAYSESLIQIGVSVVAAGSLARRIDSNVVNLERAMRELPAAELSITLPILLAGISPDEKTPIIDVSNSKFEKIQQITGKGKTENRWRIINGIAAGMKIEDIGPDSPVGPTLSGPDDDNNDE